MANDKQKEGVCELCDRHKPLTDEHVIPQWLEQKLDMFGIAFVIIGNKRRACAPCNQKKGGNIDYTDPGVREFIRAFANELLKKIK